MPRKLEGWARRKIKAERRKVDHAGLQPVQVEVHGPTGTHTSTRWKRLKEVVQKVKGALVKLNRGTDYGKPSPAPKSGTMYLRGGAKVHMRQAERALDDLSRWADRKLKKDRRKAARAKTDADVVATIQREAKAAGATLKNDGKGGLDPNLALARFRASGWRCGNKFCPTPKVELDLDHSSGHPKEIFESLKSWQNPKLRAAVTKADGPKDDRFVSVLCSACHDVCHERERAIENGNTPPPMRGTAGKGE